MNKYTVLLGYLDNSHDVSVEHVEADSPEAAIFKAKYLKFQGDSEEPLTRQEEDGLSEYPVFGCFLGHLENLAPAS